MGIAINYLAVLVGAIANMVIGMAWYSPQLFGKPWMREMGYTPEKIKEAAKAGGMGGRYFAAFVGALLMSYVVAHFALVWEVTDVMGAFQLAFWTWLGIVAPVMLGGVLWENKSWKWYVISAPYYLVTLFVMSLIFAFWQ